MKKLFVLFVFLLVSCSPSYKEPEVDDLSNYSYRYAYTIIDGMPCIINDEYRGVAISCDWSQWNGQVINGEIVIGE